MNIYYKSHDNDVEKTRMIHKKLNKDSNELSHRLVEENNPLQFFKWEAANSLSIRYIGMWRLTLKCLHVLQYCRLILPHTFLFSRFLLSLHICYQYITTTYMYVHAGLLGQYTHKPVFWINLISLSLKQMLVYSTEYFELCDA